jgi:hypothetical protein
MMQGQGGMQGWLARQVCMWGPASHFAVLLCRADFERHGFDHAVEASQVWATDE